MTVADFVGGFDWYSFFTCIDARKSCPKSSPHDGVVRSRRYGPDRTKEDLSQAYILMAIEMDDAGRMV